MSKRKVRLVILCEDLQQEVFARTFFLNCGFERRKIISRPYPAGKGAGEQWVLGHYLQEVQEYRRRSSEAVCLAVIIDADPAQTVPQRLTQFDQLLASDGRQRRQPAERIAIFVPKRNIETWIHYLMGTAVEEESAYPKFSHREGDCKPHVEKLVHEICPIGLPGDAPSSVLAACQELQRIL